MLPRIRLLILAALVGTLGSACTDILYPGTEWVTGTWRLASEDLRCMGQGTEQRGVIVLRLETSGAATLSEDGEARVQTRFSTKRDHAREYGTLVLQFERSVWGGRGHVISSVPADTLYLGEYSEWCVPSKFVRHS